MPDTTISTLNPIAGSIHGPYEDLFIAGISLLELIIKEEPADVKQKLWSDFLAFHDRLQTFGSKIDVFHLFTAKQ